MTWLECPLLLRITFLAFFSVLLTLRSALADQPMFHAEEGLAIGGYDTVAFFVDGHAVPGHADHAVMWKGAIWRFVSADNQYSFEADPRAYAPMFGGYCAYAVSQGYLMSGSPQAWQIVDDSLYLLYNSQVQEIWSSEMSELIMQARGNWPSVLRYE